LQVWFFMPAFFHLLILIPLVYILDIYRILLYI
jgi:hypothetical protein